MRTILILCEQGIYKRDIVAYPPGIQEVIHILHANSYSPAFLPLITCGEI